MLPLAAQDKGLGGVLESRSLLQRYGIAARTEAFHAIRGGHPDIGQVAKFLARLRIGQVNLDHRHRDRLDRIEQGDRGMGIGRSVQQHRLGLLPIGVMQQVDQLAFVIGLVKTDRQPQLLGLSGQHILDIGQRLMPVNLRLALAEQIGAIAIDDSKVDPVQAVLDETMGLGADRGCECVGYQAHDPQGNEDTTATLNMLINSVRFTGRIGTVGVFVPQDPGAKDDLAKQGKAAIDFGTHWFKGQTMGNGQAPVKRYNRQLRDLIAAGKATPSWIVSHEISLDQAADAYKNFDARSKGWTKVLIKPGMSNGKKEN